MKIRRRRTLGWFVEGVAARARSEAAVGGLGSEGDSASVESGRSQLKASRPALGVRRPSDEESTRVESGRGQLKMSRPTLGVRRPCGGDSAGEEPWCVELIGSRPARGDHAAIRWGLGRRQIVAGPTEEVSVRTLGPSSRLIGIRPTQNRDVVEGFSARTRSEAAD